MRTANLSILGLYNYNSDVFGLMQLPEGIDRENVIMNIITELAELELMLPSYDIMRMMIGVWSNSHLYKWDKLYKTMLLEYNPIDNYDRTETRKLNSKGKGTGKDGGSDTSTNQGDSTEQIAGFNSSPNTLVDKGKINSNNTQTNNYGKTTDSTFEKDDTEEIHARGNIGVTTTQQMMEQERNIADFNIYDIITNDFKQKFCLLVY